jgi:hypothetical protein
MALRLFFRDFCSSLRLSNSSSSGDLIFGDEAEGGNEDFVVFTSIFGLIASCPIPDYHLLSRIPGVRFLGFQFITISTPISKAIFLQKSNRCEKNDFNEASSTERSLSNLRQSRT